MVADHLGQPLAEAVELAGIAAMDHAGAALLDLGEVEVGEPGLQGAAEQVVGVELQLGAAKDEIGGVVVGGDEAGEGRRRRSGRCRGRQSVRSVGLAA